MNNLVYSIKKFLKNKNTVTIIGVVLIVGILYFMYNSQIDAATTPIQIPVANQTIQPKTLITADMVTYISVPSIAVSSNVIRASSLIVGQYSNYNTTIPEGSMFYTDVVVSGDTLPDSSFTEIPEGEVVFNFPVTISSTFGNSIFPGNYIDIYMKAVDETGKIMVGKLLSNVEILAVKDSSGQNVFENATETRTPAYLIFSVTEEINILLRKAQYMSTYSVELIPVPVGGSVDTSSGTQVSTTQLKEFIEANTVNIPLSDIDSSLTEEDVEEDLTEETEDTTEE
ncbi:MAG: hypothetical protein R3Y21_02075 [Mycoplasmatota bacterium]